MRTESRSPHREHHFLAGPDGVGTWPDGVCTITIQWETAFRGKLGRRMLSREGGQRSIDNACSVGRFSLCRPS